MKKENKKIEILAPAGNIESFYCALNAGADAIYMGLQEFNARGNIENFSLDNLREVLDYAHLFGVKIYLTFNTLIKNEEMQHALEIVGAAYKMGVDAFIVQDLGLALNIKKFYPEAVLHASTQMGIHNLEGAKVVEELGFTRVVLSRETPLEEIKRIRDNTSLEIEYFVQGALCVAFSGNCYLCSLLTGNSGNRGKCQQFCRLPYKVEGKVGVKEGYLLSTKDFCMLPILKELTETGVISLKIEGRARRPAYVAQCVMTYRKTLDNNFKYTEKDIIDLKKVFNRGDFIPGYFKEDKIIYSDLQGHKGINIGKVEKVELGKKFNLITISSSKEINKGDGLKFIKNNKECGSIGVGDVKKVGDKYIISTTAKIEKDSEVYLTLDSKNEAILLSKKRKIKIDAEFNSKINEKAELIFKYKDKKVSVISESEFSEAKNQPLQYDSIYEQLSKLKDTPFELNNLQINIENIFAKKSEINNMRRICVEKLIDEILSEYKKERKINKLKINYKNNIKINSEQIIKIEKLSILDDLKNKVNKIIYSPNNFNFEEINKFVAYCEKTNKEGFIELPIFATEKDILFIKKILKNVNTLGIVANNYYALNLCNKNKIIAGMGLNIYNNSTLEYYEKSGVKNVILSKELRKEDQEDFSSNCNLFAWTKGREEYMTLKHCPFKEFFNSQCKSCKYCDDVVYKMQNGKKLLLQRKKIVSCQFILKSLDVSSREIHPNIGEYVEKDK